MPAWRWCYCWPRRPNFPLRWRRTAVLTLEDVLRDTTKRANNEAIVKIMRTITRKILYDDVEAVREGAGENKYHAHTQTEAKRLV